MAEPGAEQRTAYTQRLRAAVHYTVGCFCEEIGEDKQIEFSKETIAAISETTFRQCDVCLNKPFKDHVHQEWNTWMSSAEKSFTKENFAKDLECFAKHGKRTTINTDDVKLLARRSKALQNLITEKCDQLAAEQKEKKMVTTGKGKKKSDNRMESTVTENEDITDD